MHQYLDQIFVLFDKVNIVMVFFTKIQSVDHGKTGIIGNIALNILCYFQSEKI